MKKIILILTTFLVATGMYAQKYDAIRNTALLQQFQKAKDDLDKAMTNEKFTSKAEAFILKAYVYASLAMDQSKKDTPEASTLLHEADAAFNKYKTMDASLALVTDQVYQNGAVNLYSGFYTLGYNDYKDKKWNEGYTLLKKAMEYSDLLIDKKLISSPIDTNLLILAGITAENAKQKDDAALYYGKLADNKVGGDGFESVYRFLVNYYFTKNDYVAFEKFKTLGGQLYPKSEFFKYDKVDFAVGLQDNFEAKLKAVENVLASDPTNSKANQVLGEIIYDTLNPRDENAILPANADALEQKMISAFQKSAAENPSTELPYLYIGDHYINKASKAGKEREAHQADMKSRSKPGKPDSKEDIAKRDALDKKYGDILEQAKDPYERVAAIYTKKTSLDLKDKQQYKKAVGYLADIAAFKKAMSNKVKNTTDAAKYGAEEKKWNDLWESL
ncbi:MAG: hypothetical protein V9F46_12685 [Chitinophagaceae bacterium]